MTIVRTLFTALALIITGTLCFAEVPDWLAAKAVPLDSFMVPRSKVPLNLPPPLPYDDGSNASAFDAIRRNPVEPGRDRDPLDQGADNCPATVIPANALPYTDTGTTVGRVSNWDTANLCGAGPTNNAPDVIYVFTPVVSAVYTIGLCNSGAYNNIIEVRTGGPCPGNTAVACDDFSCNGAHGVVTIPLTAGIAYYIVVEGDDSEAGVYQLDVSAPCIVNMQSGDIVECAETPDSSHARLDCNGGCNNDDFGGVNTFQVVPLNSTVFGRGFYYLRNSTTFRDTDWYQVTLTQTARLRIILDTEFEARVDVENNCAAGSLEVGFFNPCAGGELITGDCLSPGVYYVAVAPSNSSGSLTPLDYRLQILALPCSPCADNSNLFFAPIIFSTAFGGTCSSDNDCPAQASEDHLLEVYIPTDGEWSFKMCGPEGGGSLWNSFLSLNTGCCGGTIASNDDYCDVNGFSRIDCVPLTAGIYYILIEGVTVGDCGSYTMIIDRCDGRCCYESGGDTLCEVTSPDFCSGIYDGFFTPGGNCAFGCVDGVILGHPNGGECFLTGAVDTIRWSAGSGTVNLELNRTYPSAAWEPIVIGTPNDGEYVWTVSAPLTYTARVRVTHSSFSALSDTSDANFGIIYLGPDTSWTQVHGNATDVEIYQSLDESPREYVLVAGTIDPAGGQPRDITLDIVEPNGAFHPVGVIGDPDFDEAVGHAIVDADENFVICGSTNGGGLGLFDGWITKTDGSGIPIWSVIRGGSNQDFCFWVEQTTDEGYIVSGSTRSSGAGNSDAWLIKLDRDGVVEWEETYGGAGDDFASQVKVSSDGGYIFVGLSNSFTPSFDGWAVKVDGSGVEEWSVLYGDNGSDYLSEVHEELSSGDFICAGRYTQADGNDDILLMRISSLGDTEDRRILDKGEDEVVMALMADSAGYTVGGNSFSPTSPQDFFLLHVDFNFNPLWTREYGQTVGNCRDAIGVLAGGGFLMAGALNNDSYLIRIGDNPAPPCPEADSLVIKHNPGFLANNALRWHCQQTGTYRIYSTTNPNLMTSPPGAGWTLEGSTNGIAGTQALFVDFIFGDPTIYRRYVVTLVCP